jgi:copper oxidase (laccase) domain-containing protein
MGPDTRALHCYVGPSISQKAYRFEEEIFEKKLDSSWDEYTSREPDGIHINLLGYVLGELSGCGLAQSNIIIEDVDTGSDPDYFSHRRHKLTGEPDGRNALGACLVNT